MVRIRSLLTGAAAAIGAAAILRMQREARKVRAGSLHGLGPAGTSDDEEQADELHRRVRSWRPDAPRTTTGRALAGLWAAPLTAIGWVAALAGGRVPRWDTDVDAFVVPGVRGPFRWFLAQQGATAATLGHVVVTRDAAPDRVLLRHEAQHARQQERLGLFFAIAYPLAGARWGYRNNPFEVAARRAARVNGPAGPS